jgi:hypothetical protein
LALITAHLSRSSTTAVSQHLEVHWSSLHGRVRLVPHWRRRYVLHHEQPASISQVTFLISRAITLVGVYYYVIIIYVYYLFSSKEIMDARNKGEGNHLISACIVVHTECTCFCRSLPRSKVLPSESDCLQQRWCRVYSGQSCSEGENVSNIVSI